MGRLWTDSSKVPPRTGTANHGQTCKLFSDRFDVAFAVVQVDSFRWAGLRVGINIHSHGGPLLSHGPPNGTYLDILKF
jgi:hypothetical protein